jgi:hypothetical protein
MNWHTKHSALLLVTLVMAACDHNKGRVEGRIEYVDSSWDPDTEPPPVPRLLVHIVRADQEDFRVILSSYEQVVARGVPGRDVDGIVDHVQNRFVEDGQVLRAAEVGADGRFSFDKLPRGHYIVFADYTSDLGYFGWLLPVEVQGTRTKVVELTYETRLPIVIPLDEMPSSTTPPPPPLDDMPRHEPPPPTELELTPEQAEELRRELGIDDSS